MNGSDAVVMIGVAGGTGSGKTSLVNLVCRRLTSVGVLDLDSYYRDRCGDDLAARQRANYDEPAAIDLPLLLGHLRALAEGRSIEKPRYSFEAHARIGVEALAPARVVLLDGLFVLWWPELRNVLQLKIFVDAPADVRLARRVRRDVMERGRDVDSIVTQYLTTVRPMHERYVEPTRQHADLVLTNLQDLSACVDRLLTAVRTLVEGPRARVPTR